MFDNYFLTPTLQNGCIEEIVIFNNNLLKYSLSNSLDDIGKAIYSRTGHNVNLENATWKLNKKLSNNVKHLMNSHNVIYSMITDIRDNNVEFIAVNMHVGNNWYITGYNKIKNEFVNWETIDMNNYAYNLFRDILNEYISSSDDDLD